MIEPGWPGIQDLPSLKEQTRLIFEHQKRLWVILQAHDQILRLICKQLGITTVEEPPIDMQ